MRGKIFHCRGVEITLLWLRLLVFLLGSWKLAPTNAAHRKPNDYLRGCPEIAFRRPPPHRSKTSWSSQTSFFGVLRGWKLQDGRPSRLKTEFRDSLSDNRNYLAEWRGTMCLSFLRKQQSRLVPAEAGIQAIWNSPTFWTPAFAGMTPFIRLHFALEPSSPVEGEAGCFIRLKCYRFVNQNVSEDSKDGQTH